ncbi:MULTISPECIES: cation-translocating P-type ATPase [unclassified Arthrobacter]|uniref:cation-translocating P-type ATPase n=1 Tax=unclassified Arthrobacter TaxID=235627 RepID=UPI002DFD219A|nr:MULTISPECIES: cation-transporting P-type ATPase [unclassified Arthrobacter]MEC5193322.1 magnesium-transporting ATPase (P-type) [Arthrobacter sp. MP_M4]MEC5204788.1 magnesium-transporting ATPase (P-type) [Arthrobacter sp. MP_M7]
MTPEAPAEGTGAGTLPGVAGLSSSEAARRLAQAGANKLPETSAVPAWRRLLAELTHFFAVLLWCASVLAYVAGMPQLAIAIAVVILVNGVFAYIQQERAQHAAAKLRELLPAMVSVRRDGRILKVHTTELVPGDAVVLVAGDRVPADLRLAVAAGCSVDESMLTGESEALAKVPGNTVFGGTFLVNGQAEGVVATTGANTRLAEIAALTGKVEAPPSPLARELQRIVRITAVMALSIGVLFFVLSLLVGISWRDAFLFAIGVMVALVPEGLLPTVTLSLAVGAQRMAQRNALVRNLEAVETLGSTTFICTDKTGTLTQNRMNAVEVWTPAGVLSVIGSGYGPEAEVSGTGAGEARHLSTAALAASVGRAVLHNGQWEAEGDPMEAAIDALATRLAAAGPHRDEPAVSHRFAFDPRRLRESAIVGTTLYVKGAPESVIPLCGDGAGPVLQMVDQMASHGLRVLAVAQRSLPGLPGANFELEEAERGLTLLGLIGLHDPPRAEVRVALEAAREAGIKVAMVTGDHAFTAAAIARETGLIGTPELVLEGHNLPEDDAVLTALLDRDGVVVSRVTPEQKLRVARLLQRRGHVVAMTGDGVNDGPALQQADIGVAMGRSGTDVAREAADLVLLDDDFATIIAAVEQGRATYANIRRFLTYHLTDNVAELTPFVIWALSGGRFPLALSVLQILALDIGTDLLPALALGSEAPSKGTLKRPPERRHLMDRALLLRVFGLLGPVEAVFEMTAYTAVLLGAGWVPGAELPAADVLMAASGAAFTTVVLAQLANAFACRSATTPPWRLGWFSNRLLIWAVLAELGLLAVFLFLGPLAALLGHAPPSPGGLAVALAAIPGVLLADWLYKTVRHHRAGKAVPATGVESL